jgi:hypothetical protein
MFDFELPPDDQRGRNAIRVASFFAKITFVGLFCMFVGDFVKLPWLSHAGFFIIFPSFPIAVTGWCAGGSIAGVRVLGIDIPPIESRRRRVLLFACGSSLVGFSAAALVFLGDAMRNERLANVGVVLVLVAGLAAIPCIPILWILTAARWWRRWRDGEGTWPPS